MTYRATSTRSGRLLATPRTAALLLLALSLAAANSVQVASAQSALRENNAENDEDARRAAAENSKPGMFSLTTLQYGLAFTVVLVAAHPLALNFPKFFQLPLITGYLLVGVIVGPFAANLLTEGLVNSMSPNVSMMALSFISFQAGQEIYLPELRPQLKSIFILVAVLYGTAMFIVTPVLLLVEDAFFFREMGFGCQLGIALMFGSIAVLGSPATVMALKIELNSVGPFTSLMLGATMVAEFIVLASFAISRTICSIHCAKLDVSMANLLFTLSIVLANVLVGVGLAGLTILIFKIPGGAPPEQRTTAGPNTPAYFDQRTDQNAASTAPDMEPRIDNGASECTVDELQSTPPGFLSPRAALLLKGALWLSMGFMFYMCSGIVSHVTAAAFGLSWQIKFEPLLVLMVASCVAGHHTGSRHDMHVILDLAAPYMYLPFFVLTGASLKLDQVLAAMPLMTLYVLFRFAAIFVACYVAGCFLLKLPPRQYNNLWLTMTPQAGVALGLAYEVMAMSDEPWAQEFATTISAAVVVNQIMGPVLCAMGLSRAGETLQERVEENDEPTGDKDGLDKSIFVGGASSVHSGQPSSIRGGGMNSMSQLEVSRGPLLLSTRGQMSGVNVAMGNGTPRSLLPFYKVHNAVVIGDDEVAFEVALDLSLYGAQVNVPLLDEERASKWQKMNETILKRTAKGDLISYKNTLKDRDNARAMSSADVVIFTGDANRTRENVQVLKSLLGGPHPRMIAFVPDCKFSKEMKAQGVLVIQPSIALANIATRMALLEHPLAEDLSNELSTASDFSTASYFLRTDADERGSLSDMRMERRRLALSRNVVTHHCVDYDRLAEALRTQHLPMPPPPSRVSMFGTSSAAGFDPFHRANASPDFFVMHGGDHEDSEEIVMGASYGPYSSRGEARLSLPLGASRVRRGGGRGTAPRPARQTRPNFI
ncbi:hypothetical protein KRP22_008663 [Phytophthora ramorum]|uniref:uncharacterized protein n=1 Tax=Phytophthora ramorum TaxID=164328 RepID=UPI0030A632E5|nr:hypothetical protein KRP23_2644 [Phytophthora ramorum]KAH7502021.1 hypothetical protein KRP22_7495 [Phytophthora ramorum]